MKNLKSLGALVGLLILATFVIILGVPELRAWFAGLGLPILSAVTAFLKKAHDTQVQKEQEAADAVYAKAYQGSREAIEKASAADVVSSGDANGHLSAKRDSDVDSLSSGYIGNVLDRSSETVRGIFGNQGH